MESYGSMLKEARQAKNLDLDTVARETSIVRRYIEGLENEDNNAFPGEAYLIGFLRNYSEYLGIDTQTILTLYKNKQLQESPIPDGLIVKQKPKFLIPLIISLSAVVVVAIVFLVIFFVSKNKTEENPNEVKKAVGEREFVLTEKTFEERLFSGDKLIYKGKEGDVILTVSSSNGYFGLHTPVGELRIDLASEEEIDIDGDTLNDLIVYVSDLSLSDKKRGAEVRINKRHGSSSAILVTDEILSASEVATSRRKVILEDTRAYPFTINGNFRASCIFRIKVDRSDSDERYYTSGEVITRTASNGVRVWVSNINAVKFTIIADSKSYDLDIGKAGQVVAEDIRWIREADGKYKLVVIELD